MSARQPTVEWRVCGICNYQCSYCIQSPASRRGHPGAEEVDGLLAFLGRLPGRWEIKMTGGEPFAFPGFLGHIVPALADETPHAISVLTNLSAPEAELLRFAALTRGRLNVVSASLHLEHTTAEAFAARASRLAAALAPPARLVVNAVLVPGRLREIARAREVVAAAGLPFFPQLLKVGRGVHVYSDAERPLLEELVGRAPTPRDANLAPSYRGRRCFAGVEYFVLLQDGEAWSCRTARRFREGRLGHVFDGGVRLREAPVRCPYDICPCTVPANRGMIEGIGDGGTAS